MEDPRKEAQVLFLGGMLGAVVILGLLYFSITDSPIIFKRNLATAKETINLLKSH